MYAPNKALGQNFITENQLAERIVGSLGDINNMDIIEIGAGHGILTSVISSSLEGRNSVLYAVEIDERFSKKLEAMFVEDKNVVVVNEDILDWLPKFKSDRDICVFGSFPYYITSPILHAIIKMIPQPVKIVCLIQKEVAEKVCSVVPDSCYLSSFIQTFYKAEYLFTIPKSEFTPSPKVDGGVIRLVRNEVVLNSQSIEKYEGFLHLAYSHPRKMLNKPFTAEQLKLGGIDPRLRPQNLGPEEWLDFYKLLHP